MATTKKREREEGEGERGKETDRYISTTTTTHHSVSQKQFNSNKQHFFTFFFFLWETLICLLWIFIWQPPCISLFPRVKTPSEMRSVPLSSSSSSSSPLGQKETLKFGKRRRRGFFLSFVMCVGDSLSGAEEAWVTCIEGGAKRGKINFGFFFVPRNIFLWAAVRRHGMGNERICKKIVVYGSIDWMRAIC